MFPMPRRCKLIIILIIERKAYTTDAYARNKFCKKSKSRKCLDDLSPTKTLRKSYLHCVYQ